MVGLLIGGSALAGPWVNINPGGGGAFTSIGAGPTGIIVCGSDLAGAYRSLDHGMTWDNIGSFRGVPAAHVCAVGFDPADERIIYLGTEIGLLRSGDRGQTFQTVLSSGYIGSVVAARSNPSIVYAAYHSSYNTTASAIQKSTDRGQTWKVVSVNFPTGLRLLKLVVSPTDPSTVYLVSGGDLFVSGTPALYRSTDGGVSWTRVAASIGNVWDLAMDPVTPSTLYVTVYSGTPRSSWSGSVYKSTNGGDTWTLKANHTGAILIRRDQPQVLHVIDPDRDSGDSEAGVWETQDGGNTWSKQSPMAGWDSGWQVLDWAYDGCAYGMAKVLGEDLSDPSRIFWVTWQFVFGSSNAGGSFQNLFTNRQTSGGWRSRGIDNVTLASLAISEANPSQIYTGYHDIGLWRSVDGGASWESCNTAAFTGGWNGHGGNTATVLPDPARSQVVWATNGEQVDVSSLAKSTSGGAASSWTGVSGLPSGFLRGLSLDRTSPTTQRTLFITANGDVYRSVDDGAQWSLVFDCNTCRTTAVDRSNGTLVYTGGEGGMWRSTSGGALGSWARVGPSEFSGSNPTAVKDEQWEGIHDIIPDPQHAGWVFAAAYGSGRGLYRSTDQGGTWSKLRTSTYMRSVAVDPTNSNNLIVTASPAWKSGGKPSTSEGVMRSTDGGQTWSSLNDGLAWPFGGPVVFDPTQPSRVLLGSPGSGFFERTLSASGVDVMPPARILDLR